jgi:glyoxylase I family protein
VRAHHVAILVRDVDTCARFYRDVLELEPLQAPRPGVAWFRLGELILMIEPLTDAGAGASIFQASATPPQRPGLHLLSMAIRPDERASWEQRLGAHGVTVIHRSDYSLYFCDPEQNRLALSHYPDRVS